MWQRRMKNSSRGYRIVTDLHQRRRRSLGQPGCFAAPRFAGFHAEVSRRFHELGMLRLAWTEMEGRPVAAQNTILSARRRFITTRPAWSPRRSRRILAGSVWPARCGGRLKKGIGRSISCAATRHIKAPGAPNRGRRSTCESSPRMPAQLRHTVWLAQQQLRDWVKRRFIRSEGRNAAKPQADRQKC